jgi:alpha-mannosidase
VYEDAARDHAEVLQVATGVGAEAQTALAGRRAGRDDGLVVFNAAAHDRREVVELPDHQLALVGAPACGWAPVTAEHPAAVVGIDDGWIDNGLLRVEWDADGLLTSVRDQAAGREVLAGEQRGNLFQLHEDTPGHFDAWEVERSYLDHVTDLVELDAIEIVERHQLRAGVRFVRRFGNSTISQTMRLAAGSRRLEFHTDVDWHERHRFLKVAFPVAIRSTRATYEIQHGHIERPTVENTSWDEARFEVCGHRWADLSETGYGVALLNDGKYGYDIHGHIMRLSVLRAPGYPDPEADQGRHRFAYALLPHAGNLVEVIAGAEAFNLPLVILPGAGTGRVVTIDRPGVSVEAVKWADRTEGVVVRLCEVLGGRGPVEVTLDGAWTSVSRSDLLERDLEPVDFDGRTVRLELRPFELVTLRWR